MILTPDGRQCHAARREGRPEAAVAMAEDAAAELLAKAGPDFLRAFCMRLLVTRPEPDALKLRAALEEHGHEATVEPLLARLVRGSGNDFDLDGVQALIATSRYALRALKSHPLAGSRPQVAAVRGRARDRQRGPQPWVSRRS